MPACLSRCGYHVTCVESGRQLLLKLAESPGSFHLILTDVAMPDVNGLEVLRYVRSQPALQALPVIMMSAHENAGTGACVQPPPALWWTHPWAQLPADPGPLSDSGQSLHALPVFECVKQGAEDYLLKPVTQKEIKQIWQHVWRRRSTLTRRSGPAPGAQPRIEVPPESYEKPNTPSAGSKGDDDTELYTAAEMKAHCQRQLARYTRILHVIDTHPHLFPAAAEPKPEDAAAAAAAAQELS